MESVNFEASGEEIERALMDLGPLLGVSIKEETPDEAPDPAAPPAPAASASASSGVAAEGAAGDGAAEGAAGGGGGAEGGEGADSLASPGAGARACVTAAKCVLCQATLAQTEGTPKLMECLHSTCEPCIKAKIEEKLSSSRDFLGAERMTITCPACRLQCQPANMIDQRFVLEKLAQEQAGNNGGSSEQQCNSCEEPDPATSYCTDCGEFICDSCVLAHQRLKITKDHTIKSKEEAVAELQAAQSHRNAHDMFCRDHPMERLSLFCETCDRLTCRDCQLQHHRDHKYQFSTEMAAQARSTISSLLSEVSYKRVLLGSAMKVIKDRQQLIADKKKALVHDITQTVVKLTNAINTRGKQLVLRLNEVCDHKQRTLSEKKDALEQLAAITDHCVLTVNAALHQGSDTAVLYSKRAICAHLQRIKSRRADIPNPEIPVRISLALDKLPDLVRVLSTIGAIVVDGKVDGGAGSSAGGAPPAQGPYHPPAPPLPTPAPSPASAAASNMHQPSHSAVMALQHVAMHQSYVQSVSVSGGGAGGGAGGGGGLQAAHAHAHAHAQYVAGRGARAHTPLRHAHVTSTTHPHHLHGMSEMNLRGLLNASGQRGAAPPRVHPHQHPHQHAMQHAYQQMMGAYANNAYAAAAAAAATGLPPASGRRSGGPRTPSPAPLHYPPSPVPAACPAPGPGPGVSPAPGPAGITANNHHAKWHIPQQGTTNGGMELSGLMPSGGGMDYKITLSRPPGAPRAPAPAPAPSVVTSTNPKTPSPSLNGGVSSELDKVCAESVQDLMATIAKLDSNGVQVVAEPPPGHASPSPAPLVHSSTGPEHMPRSTDKTAASAASAAHSLSGAGPGPGAGSGSGDPNEDWCAVCMDGGELMCCDKCPKVFHQYCHIPTIDKLPDETETWQCLLCVNFAELPPDDGPTTPGAGGGLPPRLQKIVERVTLELYCQYDLSLAFREPVPQDNLHYHSRIARPMCLDVVRLRLQPREPSRYSHVAQFVADLRLMFRNAYAYNPPDSQIYKDGKQLEAFFDAQLAKWLPEFTYWSGEGEPPAKRSRTD